MAQAPLDEVVPLVHLDDDMVVDQPAGGADVAGDEAANGGLAVLQESILQLSQRLDQAVEVQTAGSSNVRDLTTQVIRMAQHMEGNRSSVRPKLPAKFTGVRTDLEPFLSRFRRYVDLGRLSEQEAAYQMLEAVDNTVYQYLDRLGLTECPSVARITEALTEAFSVNKTYMQFRAEFQACRQLPDESFHELAARVTELAKKSSRSGHLDDVEVRDQFMLAIADPAIKSEFGVKLESHPEWSLRHILLKLRVRERHRALPAMATATVHPVADTAAAQVDLGSVLAKLRTDMEAGFQRLAGPAASPAPTAPPAKAGTPPRCWGCGALGHFRQACQVVCQKCGKRGHTSNNCRSVQPSSTSAGNAGGAPPTNSQ